VIRLGIVDDHPAIHAALVARCADDTDLQVVATARDAAEGQALLARHDLDVIVLDLDLGDGPGGIALLGACRPDGPPVVVLSALAFPSLVRAAQERGAAGYVPKDADLSGLVAAIRTAAAGGTWFAPAAMRAARRAPRAPSAREVELLVLLLDGASNDEVAAGLDLSVKTVESHLRRLFGRYGVLSRTELVVLALREGWVRLGGTPGDAFVDIPTERPTSRS
jgi:DNA-binding NarL/FixJ family response regulator